MYKEFGRDISRGWTRTNGNRGKDTALWVSTIQNHRIGTFKLEFVE